MLHARAENFSAMSYCVQVACASACYSTLPILALVSLVPVGAKFWQGLLRIHQDLRKVCFCCKVHAQTLCARVHDADTSNNLIARTGYNGRRCIVITKTTEEQRQRAG
jgi:hypothetical protein